MRAQQGFRPRRQLIRRPRCVVQAAPDGLAIQVEASCDLRDRQRSPVRRAEVIRLTGGDAATKCPHLLRRVEIYDADKDDTLVFLTNHLTFGAAAIYKDRWQIELFFKALKQNRKIKTFVGTSANALEVQVWTALILSRRRWLLSNSDSRTITVVYQRHRG